jgi:hypothetical protein
MSVPLFLNSSFYYFERTNVSDVQTIMDDFEHQVLSHNNPVWTKPGAGLYKSPVDADGRWFDVLLTRITQQKLEMRLRDQNGVTVCTRRINCPSTNNWAVHIFTGEFHMQIDVDMQTATAEYLYAGILEPSPDPAHAKYVYGGGYRNNIDGFDSYSGVTRHFMVDNATAGYAQRTHHYGASAGTVTMALTTMNGSRIYRPVGLWCKPTGDAVNSRFCGRRYQALLVEGNLSFGAKITVPIDAGLSGLFRVSAMYAVDGARVCLRVA